MLELSSQVGLKLWLSHSLTGRHLISVDFLFFPVEDKNTNGSHLINRASLVAQKIKNSPAMWEIWSSLFVQTKPGTGRPPLVLAAFLVLTLVFSILSQNTCGPLCTAPSWRLLLCGLYIHFGGWRCSCPWVSQTKWEQIVCVLLSPSSWVVLECLLERENAVFIPSSPQKFP